jgi:hypothetical protein
MTLSHFFSILKESSATKHLKKAPAILTSKPYFLQTDETIVSYLDRPSSVPISKAVNFNAHSSGPSISACFFVYLLGVVDYTKFDCGSEKICF